MACDVGLLIPLPYLEKGGRFSRVRAAAWPVFPCGGGGSQLHFSLSTAGP